MTDRPDEPDVETMPGPAAGQAQGDAGDYLLTGALAQRIDLIRHLIDFSRQIIVVVGEEGSGKSSLLRHLRATARDNWRIARVNADPMCNAETLLARLAAGYGLRLDETRDFDHRVEDMQSYVDTARRSMLVPVVLIDDSHLLPADALLLLLRLAQPESDAAHLRVALFCDTRITRMLASPQLQAFKLSIMHTLELPAFSEEDTAIYLSRLWQSARIEVSKELTDAYVREVCAASGGTPGKINALVHAGADTARAPETATGEETQVHFRYAFAGAVVAFLIALALWAWRHHGPEPASGAGTTVAASTAGGQTPAGTPAAPVPPAEPAIQPKQTVTATAPLDSHAAAPPAPPAEAGNRPVAVVEAPKPAPAPVPAGTTAAADSTRPAAAPAETTPPPITTAKPAPAPKPASAAASTKSGIKGEDWLRRQPPGNFAVQLFGSHEHDAVVQFIEQHHFTDKAAVYSTVRDRQTLYVAVYGSYPGKAGASAAIAKMPADVRALKPWPRRIGDIQKIMSRKR